MNPEPIEWLSAEEAAQLGPVPLTWARIVWVDRSYPFWRTVLNRWIARPAVEGRVVWEHNHVYLLGGVEGGWCQVKVGDIRDGAVDFGEQEGR